MGIKLTFTPTGDVVEDKEIVVQGEVHNAREYMEQFKANHYTSFGINSQRNVFFAPKKTVARLLDRLFRIFVFFVFSAVIIKGSMSTPKNEIPIIPIACFFGIIIFYVIYGQVKGYFRRKPCTTCVNGIIVGKHLRLKSRANHSVSDEILTTVFLVEYNAKIYVLCEREDGTEYGGVGDQVPIFIHPENPFVFYTEQYKKSCSKRLLGLIGMLCLDAIFIYWCCSSIK